MKTYAVTDQLSHDGKSYVPGDEVQLAAGDADRLRAAGVIGGEVKKRSTDAKRTAKPADAEQADE